MNDKVFEKQRKNHITPSCHKITPPFFPSIMTPTTSAQTFTPMAPLSSPCVPKRAIPSHPGNAVSATTSSTSTVSMNRASLEITIITAEQVPSAAGTTTTVERKLKLRLALPPSYSAKDLRSLNVRIHQDAPTPPTSPTCFNSSFKQPTYYGNSCLPGIVPSSVPSSTMASPQQQQWQQQQLHLFQDDQHQQVLPTTVPSSQDCVVNDNVSPPRNKRRRPARENERTRNTAPSTTQSSTRKKRKVAQSTNNLAQ